MNTPTELRKIFFHQKVSEFDTVFNKKAWIHIRNNAFTVPGRHLALDSVGLRVPPMQEGGHFRGANGVGDCEY